jgi:hypothetical protein
MQTSSPLWRRGFLVAHAGWREDIGLGDDLEYHVRLLADAGKLCFVPQNLFLVREHRGSRLSADRLSHDSLDSLIRTRRAVHATLRNSDLWDAPNQRRFLDAMRTVYANALQLGDADRIRTLEEWLWTIAAGSSRQSVSMRGLILLRRALGRRFVLSGHDLLTKFRQPTPAKAKP